MSSFCTAVEGEREKGVKGKTWGPSSPGLYWLRVLTSNGSYGFTFSLMVQIMCGPTFHNVEDSQSTAVSTKTVSSRISGYLNEFL